MSELIIGKWYYFEGYFTDLDNNKELIIFIALIQSKENINGEIIYTGINKDGETFIINTKDYYSINEYKNYITPPTPDYYGGKENPHEPRKITKHYKLTPNLANVIKYVVRAGIKFPTLQGKIDDLQKAINYLRFEIEDLMEEIDNLEKEKNNG